MPLTQDDVEFGCWLTASDHAALTQMTRDLGMTQAQVVSRLIGMVGRINALDRWDIDGTGQEFLWTPDDEFLDPDWVRHSDLTAAVAL